ncbi:hypothetical protein DFH29DRAFT_883880 [Suillus ampliporus]|nr:hypothetical protein DFH29DRAFT_883880 [Suillus ampliporus]
MPRTYTCDCLRLCGGILREVTRAQWRYHEQFRGPQTAARISVWQLRENAGVSCGTHTAGTSNEKDGDEELGNQADQDNDPYLFPGLIDEQHFTGAQQLEPDDGLIDEENFMHPQHSDKDSGTSAEGRNEHGDPLPLDVDEEVLMNEVYDKVWLDDLRTSLAMIMGIQNAELDDSGIGLSADSLERLRNPLRCCSQDLYEPAAF